MDANHAPHDPKDRHAPTIKPQPAARPRRDEEGYDKRLWTYGTVIVVIIAGIAVIGAVVWTFRDNQQTSSRPQPPIIGTFGQSLRPEAPAD
jgi:hypothetical protein